MQILKICIDNTVRLPQYLGCNRLAPLPVGLPGFYMGPEEVNSFKEDFTMAAKKKAAKKKKKH